MNRVEGKQMKATPTNRIRTKRNPMMRPTNILALFIASGFLLGAVGCSQQGSSEGGGEAPKLQIMSEGTFILSSDEDSNSTIRGHWRLNKGEFEFSIKGK